MPAISIIIPIYNAESYLNLCIESILSQQFKDFELLLINDGSKDRSLEICNEYAAKDSRIKVFDKPNGGVSSARNMGLDNASGEYIMFVDADDMLIPNALSLFTPYIPQYDFVRMNILAHNSDGSTQKFPLSDTKDKTEAMKLNITLKIIVGPVSAIFRRKLFEDHNIRFNTNIQLGEDWLVTTQFLYHSKTFIFLPDKFVYLYNKTNENSCTNNLTLAKCVQHYLALREIEELVSKEEKIYRSSIRYTKTFIARIMMVNLDRASVIEWFKVQPNIDELLSWKDILLADISLSKKKRLFSFLMRVHSARRKR